MENKSAEIVKCNGEESKKTDQQAAGVPPPIDKVETDRDTESLLNEKNLEEYKENPLGLFQVWFQQAFQHLVPEPFIMSLATSSASGIPSVRPVSLCNVDARGLYFVTNIHSRKVNDLKENPRASVSFYWIKLDRVVRVEGNVVKVEGNNEKFFQTWPRDVQIAEHSRFNPGQTLDNRDELVAEMETLVTKFAEMDTVPLPRNILTYCIEPLRVEFLQIYTAQPVDRIEFKRPTVGERWSCSRLSR